MRLDPGVGDRLVEQVLHHPVLKEGLSRTPLKTHQLAELLRHTAFGLSGPLVEQFPTNALANDLRTASTTGPQGFEQQLKKELDVLIHATETPAGNKTIVERVVRALEVPEHRSMRTNYIPSLRPFQAGEHDLFADVAKPVRDNIVRAIKRAFGYTAGVSVGRVAQTPGLATVFSRIAQADKHAFMERLNGMAVQDSRESINKLFRGSINVARDLFSPDHAQFPTVQQAEALTPFIEKATSYHRSFAGVLTHELQRPARCHGSPPHRRPVYAADHRLMDGLIAGQAARSLRTTGD